MFLSAIIPLTALCPLAAQTRAFWGRQAHALFLHLVQSADPTLADALHTAREDKPFTVSNPKFLMRAPSPPAKDTSSPQVNLATARARPEREQDAGAGLPSVVVPQQGAEGVEHGVRAGDVFEWRITAFEKDLVEVLRGKVLPELPREVRLGAARFAVGAPRTERAQHSWAGTSDAAELTNRWFHTERHPDKRITLQFASPTAYRQIHRTILVPNPAGIFAGYLKAWNAYCAPRLEPDLADIVESQVAISSYRLHTAKVDFGDYRETGWVGTCTFSVLSDEIALRRVLHLLADFAFYCGTGYKTTQGMGQTRKLAERDASAN